MDMCIQTTSKIREIAMYITSKESNVHIVIDKFIRLNKIMYYSCRRYDHKYLCQ